MPPPYGYPLDLDLLQRDQRLRVRLDASRRESRALDEEGRPPFYAGRLAIGFSVAAVGGGALALGLGLAVLHNGPHSGESDGRQSNRFMTLAGSGAIVGVLGACVALSATWSNRNRDEIRGLEREQTTIIRELHEIKRERKRRLKYGMAPMYSRRGGHGFALSVQMAL